MNEAFARCVTIKTLHSSTASVNQQLAHLFPERPDGLSVLAQRLSDDKDIPRGRGGPDTSENCVSACRQCNEERNRSDALSPGHKGPPTKRIHTAVDFIAALGEASKQRDAAVQQLNAQRARNQQYLADLWIFLNQRSAASH